MSHLCGRVQAERPWRRYSRRFDGPPMSAALPPGTAIASHLYRAGGKPQLPESAGRGVCGEKGAIHVEQQGHRFRHCDLLLIGA